MFDFLRQAGWTAFAGRMAVSRVRFSARPEVLEVSGSRSEHISSCWGSGERCIYHTPSGEFYSRTKPERCYVTGEDAVKDGCRRSRR